MEALTLEQYTEIVNFVQKWHIFALWLSDSDVKERNKTYFNMAKWGEHGMDIKYIDCTYDSRDNKIWLVKLRFGKDGYVFSSNHFGILTKKPADWRWNTLYDIIMAFLKGEMTEKQAKPFEMKNNSCG